MKLANLIRGNDRGAVSLRLTLCASLVGLSAGVGAVGMVGPAAAAPTTFTLDPIKAAGGASICDGDDENPNYADVGCDAAGNSAYFGSDGTLLGAAIILRDNPAQPGVPGPVESTTYVVQLGVGGVHRASFGVDGKGTNDDDYVYAGCAGAAVPTYTRLASAAIADGSLAMTGGGSVFRMTFNVPLSALATCGITSTTAMAPFVGTSQAGPLDNINKDFFLGNSVSFGSVNTPPVAVNDSSSTARDTAVSINVLSNDTDADAGDTLSIGTFNAASTQGGSVALVAGQLQYTPATGFVGTDTFTYRASDGTASSNSATVTVTVSGPGNTAPVAENDARTTAFNTALSINVLSNDTDADAGDTLSIGTFDAASTQGGSVALVAGQLEYTPATGFVGADTFTYRASDGTASSNIATVTVTVNGPGNTAPVAVNDARTTGFNTAILIDVLANDTDVDNDPLTAVANAGPSNGTISAYGPTGVTYTPNAGFTGVDTFTYKANDGTVNSNTAATVTVTVSARVNTAPVAVADSETTPFNTPVTVDVLANDSDADGDALTATAATGPANGTVTYGAGGATYTPNAGFSGTDTFSYTASDGKGGTATATVTVTVSPQVIVIPGNTPPNAVDDAVSTAFGVPVTINVMSNDSDPDGDPIHVVQTTGGTGTITAALSESAALRLRGALSVPTTGSLVYTPAAGFSGADSFTYLLSDGRGGTDTASVVVNVAGPVVAEPTPTAEPTEEPTAAPSPSASPIGGVTSPEPATGSPSQSPLPTLPFEEPDEEEPAAEEPAEELPTLPFTGSSTDMLLGLGAGLSVLGLMLVLTGRSRRAAE